MRLKKYQIMHQVALGGPYYRIALKTGDDYAQARPGQFVMLQTVGATEPLLRRPFSIYRMIEDDAGMQGIELLYKVVGPVTQALATCRAGDMINLLGPLGNGFAEYEMDAARPGHIWLVAGGVGTAPLVFLAQRLAPDARARCEGFVGGYSARDLPGLDAFSQLGITVHVCTEDGSHGRNGRVTDLLADAIGNGLPSAIYACGPMGMLQAVAQMAEAHNVACRVSVETMMACGMGACLGCAMTPRDRGARYLHACTDGPVFDSRDLDIFALT